MRNTTILTLFFLFAYIQNGNAQHQTCCSMSSVKQFAELGKDLSFVISHEAPLPYKLEYPKGKMVSFPIKGEDDGHGYYIKGSVTSKKWILVIQEWWGLNDYIKNESDKLHDNFPDAHIIALDMYDGKVATTPEDASKYMQGAKPERLEKIVLGASNFAGNDARIASIGWCFGGGWSNKIAVMLGDKAAACVIYYGMPVMDENQIKKIKAPVLGIFATKDGWITPQVVAEFKAMMQKGGKSIEIYSYDAEHAFANPSNPKYNKKEAEDAWLKTKAFIQKNL